MNIKIKLPGSWNDLSYKQLLIVSKLLSVATDRNKFLHKAFFALSGIRIIISKPIIQDNVIYYPVRFRFRRYFLSDAMILDLKQRLVWLLEPSALTVQKIKFLAGRRGPDSGLRNITWAEFEKAEKHFNEFTRTRKPIELDKLIATLYRKEAISELHPSYQGDTRQMFNPHHVASNVRFFKRIDPIVKMSVYIFYSGCRNNIIKQFPHVFDSSSGAAPDPLSAFKLINSINNGDVTRNELIRYSPLFELLLFLEQRLINTRKE